VGIVIGLAFAGVGIAIIGVTIRITILQRATEISIMRLVGATNRYIRSPFLLEGFIKGLTGGILAVALCWLVLVIFRKTSADLGQSLVFFGGLEIALMLVFGAALGLLGTMLSVGRQLRNV
jgi:cell division transport system permease protein